MATQAQSPVPGVERSHIYHAEANILSADLEQPFREKVKPRAEVVLAEGGHYQFREAEPFRVEGLISYKSGYTQVAGHRSVKHGHGFATLTTSVVEDLNVLDVLTADRVVGQIFTEHPLEGQVPSVSFLGTRFENLRIAGREVEVNTNLDILGPKPAEDKSYFDEESVLDRMAEQYENLSTAEGLPDWAGERFPRDRGAWQKPDEVRCSLVNEVMDAPRSFGHVIDIPHFGKVFLGELRVNRKLDSSPKEPEYYTYTFHLTMIGLELGCPVVGKARIISADSNGGGSQGGGSGRP